jgi:hypothetical protein
VVLSGANDLGGLMEIDAGSLVIADAGSPYAWSVDGERGLGQCWTWAQALRACQRSDWRQAQCRAGV